MQYKITHVTEGKAIIEAHRFVKDGSGTTFYGENGEQIASFYDGEIRTVVPIDILFTAEENAQEDPLALPMTVIVPANEETSDE